MTDEPFRIDVIVVLSQMNESAYVLPIICNHPGVPKRFPARFTAQLTVLPEAKILALITPKIMQSVVTDAGEHWKMHILPADGCTSGMNNP